MKNIRIYVGAVWPSDRVALDLHSTKEIGVSLQWFKDGSIQLVLEVDDAFRAIIKPQAQYKPAEGLDIGDADNFGTYAQGNGSILARL